MDKKLEKLRHSTSHILAYAVKTLFPKAKLGIGPAIEDGFYYDFANVKFTIEDLPKIEGEMQKIINRDLKFKKSIKTPQAAKKALKDEPFKLELLNELKEKPTFYQVGEFEDLCKGPHVKSTSEIKAFKLLSIAGAYWRGDEKKPMLQRIYGTAFPSKEELKEYLHLKEEAEKRNHIKLGKRLDLFSFHPEAPGFVFWHDKGLIIYNQLVKYWQEEHKKEGYQEVKTPIMLCKTLWEKSGHLDHYSENMYFSKIDNRDFGIKPMNCDGGILLYKEKLHSYREFPLKVGELGLVHRHELSGVLNGLFRVRYFTQDDAHIYCEESQVKKEVIKVIKLIDKMYSTFKLTYHVELSTMPKKHIGKPAMWKKAEKALEEALKESKTEYKLNKGDGAFYGPKIDFHIQDSLKRTWQCGTIQLDFALPERFDLTYEGSDGKKHRPVMLHRTVFGSLERFIGVLIEHFSGKLPLWLTPTHARILTLTERNIDFAKEVVNELEKNEIRAEIDMRTETLQKKVRYAQLDLIPYIITIGDKEQQNKTLAIRTLDGKVKFNVKISDFIAETKKQIETKECCL